MITYLLFGVSIGIVIAIIFIYLIIPIIQVNQEVYQYKKTDVATQYNLNSQKQAMDFYRKYPEAKENNEELSPAIGYRIDTDGCDEDDFEDKKIGF